MFWLYKCCFKPRAVGASKVTRFVLRGLCFPIHLEVGVPSPGVGAFLYFLIVTERLERHLERHPFERRASSEQL